jgi:hypothetical protein
MIAYAIRIFSGSIPMSAISLKLTQDLLEASNRCAVALKLSRAAYLQARHDLEVEKDRLGGRLAREVRILAAK